MSNLSLQDVYEIVDHLDEMDVRQRRNALAALVVCTYWYYDEYDGLQTTNKKLEFLSRLIRASGAQNLF